MKLFGKDSANVRCLDPDRRKYFKIEEASTAPKSASWSRDSVKQRKVQDDVGEAARQRAHLVKRHIRRHAITQNVVSSGLLAREMGLQPTAEFARGRLEAGDVGADAWARGIVAKGYVPFAPNRARPDQPNLPCLYVNGDDQKTGMGAIYTSMCTGLTYT